MPDPLKPIDGGEIDDCKIETIHACGHIIREHHWAFYVTVGHLGTIFGRLLQKGYGPQDCKRITIAQCEAWAAEVDDPPETRPDQLAHVGNDQILTLMLRDPNPPDVHQLPTDGENGAVRPPLADEGSIIDLGVQFGARIQAGYTAQRAYYECGLWLVRWFGGSNPWGGGVVHPGDHPDPIVGPVHLLTGGLDGLADAAGAHLLWGVHGGDLVARLLHDGEAFARDQIAYMASEGAHCVRAWPFLWGSWWATPPRPGECHPGLPGWNDAVRRFSQLLIRYKMQWLVSNGDLFRAGWSEVQRQNYMGELATILSEEGGLDLVIGVDAGNENASAGDPDAETMARTLDPFLRILRPALVSTTSSDETDLNRYVSRVCTVCDSHAGRHPYTMAIERCWTAGYWDGKARKYLSSSEPFGVGCQEFGGDNRVGHHVSATAVPRDWDDPEAMGCAAAAHFLSRQLYIYMSSPGVISDEPFSNYPALGLTGRLARRLPRDVQTWDVFHGGDSNGDRRVLGVPRDDAARSEHSRNGNQYIVFVHGVEKVHRIPAINSFSGVRLDLGLQMQETPISWNRGDTLEVPIHRGCLFIGDRQ